MKSLRSLEMELALKKLRAPWYRLAHPRQAVFECPICGYVGPFKRKGERQHAKCPACGALERARLQFVVLERLLRGFDARSKEALHIAPEAAFRRRLSQRFRRYQTGDLHRTDVDYRFDVQQLPFGDGSFDLVFASHVLEYPRDDRRAIGEIRRVLRPSGVAVLPVPLVHQRTVDRAVRDPVTKMMHEPGLDYFERMEACFRRVEIIRSDAVDVRYQPFLHCPNDSATMPAKHDTGVYIDIVPVCYV